MMVLRFDWRWGRTITSRSNRLAILLPNSMWLLLALSPSWSWWMYATYNINLKKHICLNHVVLEDVSLLMGSDRLIWPNPLWKTSTCTTRKERSTYLPLIWYSQSLIVWEDNKCWFPWLFAFLQRCFTQRRTSLTPFAKTAPETKITYNCMHLSYIYGALP